MRPALALICTLACACDGTGTFDGGVPDDAGPGGGGPGAGDIGLPCSYDPTDPAHPNPTNACPTGESCLIVTRDAIYTSGLALPAWEDQFTVYNQTPQTDVGYCTLQGTLAAPPTCPAGTQLKLLAPDVAVCVRGCTNAADCGRADYTCDVRYIDNAAVPLCVRKCGLDYPDCIRSGIFASTQDPTQLFPALSAADLAGDSECSDADGICAFVAQHGTAGPGEPCDKTDQCETGAVCIQGVVLSSLLGTVPADARGFCASSCKPRTDPQQPEPCTLGYVCQSAGALNLNFVPPIVIDQTANTVDTRGGFCFHQCQAGVNTTCDAIPGTGCGSLDEAAVVDTWNGVSMCLPDAILQ